METNRLYLRDYSEGDFDFLKSLLSDPEVVRYIGHGTVKTEDEMKAFFRWIQHTYVQHADFGLKVVCLKENDEPIGHAGLVPQTIEGVNELEVGYWIGRRYWRNGYASEIAEELKRYGFENLNRQRLNSLIQPENEGSVKVAKKIGMKLDKKIKLKGKDVHVYAVEQG
ncbi:GNAT family N-acetyltransferase [Filobacillus milosensis]|nr:GNAT family N-acetyltransferase [Filobacillus milosensis]